MGKHLSGICPFVEWSDLLSGCGSGSSLGLLIGSPVLHIESVEDTEAEVGVLDAGQNFFIVNIRVLVEDNRDDREIFHEDLLCFVQESGAAGSGLISVSCFDLFAVCCIVVALNVGNCVVVVVLDIDAVAGEFLGKDCKCAESIGVGALVVETDDVVIAGFVCFLEVFRLRS